MRPGCSFDTMPQNSLPNTFSFGVSGDEIGEGLCGSAGSTDRGAVAFRMLAASSRPGGSHQFRQPDRVRVRKASPTGKSVAQHDKKHAEDDQRQTGDVGTLQDFLQVKATEQQSEHDLDLPNGAHQRHLGDREAGEPAG